MKRALFVVLLLFLGCGYKGVQISLPSLSYAYAPITIKVENDLDPPWLLGHIFDKKGKISGDITTKEDIGAYLKKRFLQKFHKKERFSLLIHIHKFLIKYYPWRLKENIGAILNIEITKRSKNQVFIKKIIIKRAAFIAPLFFEREIERLVLSMLDEAVQIMVQSL